MHRQPRDQSSGSTTTTDYPHSQYHFPVDSGPGLVYGTSGFYPSHSMFPLPAPQSSSSSLAAALVPPPEPQSRTEATFSSNSRSQPPVRVVTQGASQRVPPEPAAYCGRPGQAMSPTDAVNTPAQPGSRRFVDTSAAPPTRVQDQIHQREDVQMYPVNLSQSSGHLYNTGQNPSASVSIPTGYIQSQRSDYMQTEDTIWPPDAGFSLYSNAVSFPLQADPTTLADPSHFPPFSQDLAYNHASVSGPMLSGQGAGGGISDWPYAQVNGAYPSPDELYYGYNETNAAASAWSPAFGPQFQHVPSASISAPDRRSGAESASGPGTGSDSVSSQSVAASDSYSGGRPEEQRHQPTDAAIGTYAVQASMDQQPYRASPQSYDGERQQDLYSQSQRTASSSLPVPSQSEHIVQHGQAPAAQGRRDIAVEQQYPTHNTLMPPPPVPVRTYSTNSVKRQRSDRTAQSTPERRHIVASSPYTSVLTNNNSVPPTVATPPVGSARSTPAAPESSSSSSSRDATAPDSPATPRMAVTHLNDAMWAQAETHNRCALSETFRIRHGSEPPAEMHIKGTSALERSRRIDVALLSSLETRRAEQAHGDQPTALRGADETKKTINTSPIAGHLAPQSMSDEDFFNCRFEPGLAPARSGYEPEQETSTSAVPGREGARSSSVATPVSPSSTDRPVPHHDANAPISKRKGGATYAFAAPANASSLPTVLPPTVLVQHVMPLMRHDGHLASHVSGLGGGFQNAYDGRSYLTDDSEQDPNHLPPPPPGARSGDHPSLAPFKPHPLMKRGEVWHEYLNPGPRQGVQRNSPDEGERTEDLVNEDGADQTSDRGEASLINGLEEEGVKNEEKGEGWGFVEGGSHGRQFALPDTNKTDSSSKRDQRLKLTTEKKTPPKIACHFCRNRKIACGASKCGDPTLCNQCERRSLRCNFPTESRRGMRTKRPRSSHTVGGTGEADEDFAGHDNLDDREGNMSAEVRPSGSADNPKVPREKSERSKGTMKGRGRGRRKGKASTSKDVREDMQIDEADRETRSEMQVNHPEDPLASLAAEMEQQNYSTQPSSSEQLNAATTSAFPIVPTSLPSSSLPSDFPPYNAFDVSLARDGYSFQSGMFGGPFTRSPLDRRNQQNNDGRGGLDKTYPLSHSQIYSND